MEGENPILNKSKEGENGEEEKTALGNDNGRENINEEEEENSDGIDIIDEEVSDSSMENFSKITNEDSKDQGEENQNDSKRTEQSMKIYTITRTLRHDGKKALFIRYFLLLYYNNENKLDYVFKEINDEYLTDNEYIGSTTFKLILICKNKHANDHYDILEIFFDIRGINFPFNYDDVEEMSAIMSSIFNNIQPLFFIFSPSIYTLECYLGVLRCMEEFPKAYFIAISSPLSGEMIGTDLVAYNNLRLKANNILETYNLDKKDKYIELLDLKVEESYTFNRVNLTRPIAIKINLPNVDILLSKNINSLNPNIIHSVNEADENNKNVELTKYYYNLGGIANEVNEEFTNNTPVIPMTEGSLVNLIKFIFIEGKEYNLTFQPGDQKQIETLQSSLSHRNEEMDVDKSITISTANVIWNQNSAIYNLCSSLQSVLFNTDENSIFNYFFSDDSNPLILTSVHYKESLEEETKEPLGEFIKNYDIEYEKIADKNFLLSRCYSLYSDRQWIDDEMQIAKEYNSAELASGGSVPLKKKAVIISIILGAILIVVIVIVVVVTSRNEGFKPSMRQIKS